MAGEMQFRVSRGVSGMGAAAVITEQVVTCDAGSRFTKTMPIGTVSRVTFPVTVAGVKACSILTTKDCVIKTNSSSSPIDTLTMKANVPKVWVSGTDQDAFFFTANVTDLYFANTEEMSVTILVGWDATPVLGDV